ncbi:MAG: hypothetical protein HN368_19870 [Spirochaetales bacterium]|nr:hypothetical protein [Spirochaetales bacterium]
MNNQLLVLCLSAASVGLLHTLLGPDHYLPFIVMSRARNWSMKRTLIITAVCGIGHVLGSMVLGLIGVAVGISLLNLEAFEGFRGSIAAWLLIGFGFAYFLWGLRKAFRAVPHTHVHDHETGGAHEHSHQHVTEHSHVHDKRGRNLTPWILFTIFVFGPCEALIPLLMYPAAELGTGGMLLVTAVFGIVTIGTMTAVVMISSWGFKFARFKALERFAHAFSGAAICLSGLAIQVLGL